MSKSIDRRKLAAEFLKDAQKQLVRGERTKALRRIQLAFNSLTEKWPEPPVYKGLAEVPESVKRVLYRAWSLRNQFNGVWDRYYFPKLADALDLLFPGARYPDELMPARFRVKKCRGCKTWPCKDLDICKEQKR